MKIAIDKTFLQTLGITNLSEDDEKKLLQQIYETLEMRVGMRLASVMTDDQLTEFEAFIDKNDEAGALKWLETNYPNYPQVVQEELEKLRAEIKQNADKIVDSTKAA